MKIPKDLSKVVNKKLRLETYKRVLQYYKEGFPSNYDLNRNDGLCLAIPCTLFNCHWFNQDNWYYIETPFAFPELKKHMIDLKTADIKPTKRLEVLRAMIQELEQK